MCKPNRAGKISASQEIKEKFDSGGDARKELVKLMLECGRDKD